MTAPVTTAPSDEGIYAVRFMMPSKWTMDTLPAPVDNRVALVHFPERHLVVAGFTGPKAQASNYAAERAIDEFVAANVLSPAGPFALAGFSAPSVPDRRNGKCTAKSNRPVKHIRYLCLSRPPTERPAVLKDLASNGCNTFPEFLRHGN